METSYLKNKVESLEKEVDRLTDIIEEMIDIFKKANIKEDLNGYNKLSK